MRTVATVQDPDSGSIDLDGLNVLTQKDEVRKILGYLPQEFGVYPKLSALDMLQHLAVMKGVTNQTNLWDARKKALSTVYSGHCSCSTGRFKYWESSRESSRAILMAGSSKCHPLAPPHSTRTNLNVGAESTATPRAFRTCLSVSVLPSIRKR